MLVAVASVAAHGTDATAPDTTSLEEIVVTASRRPEPALEVPASLSVISAADLDRLHATSLVDLAAAVPGLVVTSGGSPGQTSIVLRGLPAMSSGSLISTVIDDVPVGASSAWGSESVFELDMLPYDVERIEVLRGPQGTLYGANSMGGVLKYVTRDPSLTASQAQAGSELFGVEGGGPPGWGARASAGTPLVTDRLAIRGSVYVEETPGYTVNPILGYSHENALSQYGGRFALLWQPNADTRIRVQAIYQRTDSEGDAVTFAQLLGVPQGPYYSPGAWLGGYLVYPHPVPEPFTTELKFASAAIDWQLPRFEVVSVTGYSDKRLSQFQDTSQVYGYLQPQLDPNTTSMLNRSRFYLEADRLSQEIRLVSPATGRLSWQAGAYYDYERISDFQYLDALDDQRGSIPELSPFFAAIVPAMYTETAAFGTLDLRLNEELDVSGGLRWLANRQWVENDILPNVYVPASDSITRASEHPATYAATARYHPVAQTMAYARISSGYRPGTPNQILPGYPGIPVLSQSDTMVNYELGIKAEFFDRRASIDLDAFKINWSNLQLDTATPDGRIGYSINAGKVTSEGFELTAAYAPGDAVHVTVATAYADAYATQAVPAEQIYVGTRLPDSPRWTAAAMLDCRLPDAGRWAANASATWRYISPEYQQLSTAPPVGRMPGYAWVDLTLRLVAGRYEVALFAKNMLDKQAFNNGGPYFANTAGPSAPVPPGPPAPSFGGVPVQPRTLGLSLSAAL